MADTQGHLKVNEGLQNYNMCVLPTITLSLSHHTLIWHYLSVGLDSHEYLHKSYIVIYHSEVT